MKRQIDKHDWQVRLIFAVLAFSAASLHGVPLAAAASHLLDVPRFPFEQQAQQHCPDDSVVWAIERSGIYDVKTERWYGQTTNGNYVCRKDAEAAGYRSHASQ